MQIIYLFIIYFNIIIIYLNMFEIYLTVLLLLVFKELVLKNQMDKPK